MHAAPSKRRGSLVKRIAVNVLVAGIAFGAGHFTAEAMHAGNAARPVAEATGHAGAHTPAHAARPAVTAPVSRPSPVKVVTVVAQHLGHLAHIAHLHVLHVKHLWHVAHLDHVRSLE